MNITQVLFEVHYAILGQVLGILGYVVLLIVAAALLFVVIGYGRLWLQAYSSGAGISLINLIGMTFRQVDMNRMVKAKVMIAQAGLDIGPAGLGTGAFEAQFLAGGSIENVVQAIIVANRAGIQLDFDQAAATDLAGRDILDAVRTSVSPRVFDCPTSKNQNGRQAISAISKDGVELLVHARVTVRTNLERLIGGASEETVIARVGQGIISTVGSAANHMDILCNPAQISKDLLCTGLDANTAFQIVSIDIARIDIGENVGARLQADQAEADMRTSQALAEVRRADAIAFQQEMTARVAENRAHLIAAQAAIPKAIGNYFRTQSKLRLAKFTPSVLFPAS